MTFKYIDEYERTIFLHFLNREACQACGSHPNYQEALDALYTLCISHSSGMAVNISQLLEFSEDNGAFLRKVFDFHRAEIIEMISQARSAEEFIASRQPLYEHDQKRYPMYFGENLFVLEQFKFGIQNLVSTTDELSRAVLNWRPDQIVGPVNEAITESDRQILVRIADQVQRITMAERGRAVTKALYKQREKEEGFTKRDLDIIARMVSGIYIRNYKQKGGYATCTGVSFVSYYDDFRGFPYYDVVLLKKGLIAFGLDKIKKTNQFPLSAQIIGLYQSPIHEQFVSRFNTLLGCICGAVSVNGDNVLTNRHKISKILRTAISDLELFNENFDNLQHFYEASIGYIEKIFQYLSFKLPRFSEYLSTFVQVRGNMKKILILTATQKEDDQLIEVLQKSGFSLGRRRQVGRNIARTFQSFLPIELFQLRSSAGSNGSNGSTLIAAEAISILEPDHVISVGICFGADKGEQNIGDVTVSKEMFHYDSARIGENDYISRGQKIPCSDFLLSACQQVALDGVKVHYGIVASGEKLVDNREFVDFLVNQQKEIISGEMEGTGISSACQREKTDWIMVKAICDWGYNKSKEHQELAAYNSAMFAVRVIKIIAEMEM